MTDLRSLARPQLALVSDLPGLHAPPRMYRLAGLPPSAVLLLREHPSSAYAPRTGENVRLADFTVALAADFGTAGERLTAKLAGRRYACAGLLSPSSETARRLLAEMRGSNVHILNVAGNGLATLHRRGLRQGEVNAWVLQVLREVHAARPLSGIRSGGQTGVDCAALVAGLALGLPCEGLLPHGWRQRNREGQDVSADPDALARKLSEWALRLRSLD